MGSGQAFADSIVSAHGDKPFTDIMSATDVVIARGSVDRDRMAAAGGSYGGYLPAWILGHTDRFKALVVHAGVYDLMAQFGSDSAYGRAINYGAEPWVDPARIVVFPDENHRVQKAQSARVWYGEVLNWLDRWLAKAS